MSVQDLKGDLVQLVGYDSKFQVVWTYASSREQESYETVTISEINGKQINTIGKNISSMEQFGKMDMSDVFGDLTKDMYDDFMPQAEEGAKDCSSQVQELMPFIGHKCKSHDIVGVFKGIEETWYKMVKYHIIQW